MKYFKNVNLKYIIFEIVTCIEIIEKLFKMK
jgi:hypothetical protein